MFYLCSIDALTPNAMPEPPPTPHPDAWVRPPGVILNADLAQPPNGARVVVAGLVLIRQRPGTAKGVIFVTLEDETGICNVIVWRKLYEQYRRAVISGRCLRVTGRVQRDNGVTHVVAEQVEDISWMLDELVRTQGQSEADDPKRARPVRAEGAGLSVSLPAN